MHFMHSKNISDTMKQVEEVQIMTDFQEVSTLLTLELKGTRYTFHSLQHCNWLCDGSAYLRSPPSSQCELLSCGECNCTTFMLHKARTEYLLHRQKVCKVLKFTHTLCPLYGDKVQSWRSVCEWIRMFQIGQTSVTDAECSRCTSISTALKKLEEAKAMDHRQKSHYHKNCTKIKC